VAGGAARDGAVRTDERRADTGGEGGDDAEGRHAAAVPQEQPPRTAASSADRPMRPDEVLLDRLGSSPTMRSSASMSAERSGSLVPGVVPRTACSSER
jgi:hypothetical protein